MLNLEYLWPFLLCFGMNILAGLGLPFPEELTFAGAGVWAAQAAESHGHWRWLVLPAGIVGVLVADTFLYAVGRFWGRRLLKTKLGAWVLTAERRGRIERNFRRYGVSILVFGRLVPSIRTPLFLTAGLMKLPVSHFILADAIGAVFGNSVLFILGFWMGDSFLELIHRAEDWVYAYRPVLIIGAVALVGLYLAWHYLRFPVASGDPKEDIPLIGPQVAQVIDTSAQAAGARKEREAVGAEIIAPPPTNAPTG